MRDAHHEGSVSDGSYCGGWQGSHSVSRRMFPPLGCCEAGGSGGHEITRELGGGGDGCSCSPHADALMRAPGPDLGDGGRGVHRTRTCAFLPPAEMYGRAMTSRPPGSLNKRAPTRKCIS